MRKLSKELFVSYYEILKILLAVRPTRTPIPINPKQIDSIHKRTVVVDIARQIYSVPGDHVRRAHRVQVINVNIVAEPIPLNAQDPRLTHRPRPDSRTSRAVIIKKRVQPRSIRKDIITSYNPQAPSRCGTRRAISRTVNKRRKNRVIERRIGRKRDCGIGIGLVVRGLGLYLAHEDVARVDELVLVEDVVLDGGAPAISISNSSAK